MEVWRELLETARHAPSAHNAQPWRLRPLGEREADLLVDPRRTFPVSDPDGWETLVGLGVFVECLAAAAASLALELTVDAHGSREWAGGAPVALARLSLLPLAGPEPLGAELVLRRRSSRFPYDATPVPEAVAAELRGLGLPAAHRVEVSSDPELAGLVVRLGAEAQALPARDRAIRAELRSWLRLGEREAERAGDGLSARCLAAPGSLLRLWYAAPWLVRLPGVRELGVRQRSRTMAGTASVLWVAGPPSSDVGWFEAGRMLGRLWLTATRHGLHLHPLVSVLAVPELRARLLEGLGALDGVWFLARIGSGPEPPASRRLPVDQLLA